MRLKKKTKQELALVLIPLFFVLISTAVFLYLEYYGKGKNKYISDDAEQSKIIKTELSKLLSNALQSNSNIWPPILKIDNNNSYKIEYTFNAPLEEFVKKLLVKYRSDYSSVVILNNNNGEILTAMDYNWVEQHYDKKITFYSTSPAASLFKLITAADIIEHRNISSEDTFFFKGRATTLFKYQLEDDSPSFKKELKLKSAFAKSNNVVFGKAALKFSDPSQLYQTAENFGFNKDIFSLLNLGYSYFPVAADEYNLAELASGLNTLTLISPLHAAKMAMTIANDGMNKSLKIVRNLASLNNSNTNNELIPENYAPTQSSESEEEDNNLYFNKYPFQPESNNRIISHRTAQELKIMMRETIESGTGKFLKRKLPAKIFNDLDIGAKTGQMTGGIPLGKRDWIIIYVKPKNSSQDLGISMAIMLINQEHWYVRPTNIAQEIIEYYYKNLFVLNDSHHYYSLSNVKK